MVEILFFADDELETTGSRRIILASIVWSLNAGNSLAGIGIYVVDVGTFE